MDTELKNPKGKIRTIEENKMILLLLKAELEEEIKKIKQSKDCKINWCYLELMVSKKLCVKATHVSFLRKNFFDGGNVLFCGTENIRVRGAGSSKYKNGNYKVTPDMMLSITSFVNDEHSEGKCVTARKIDSHLYSKYHLEIHRTTIGHVLAKLGLS